MISLIGPGPNATPQELKEFQKSEDFRMWLIVVTLLAFIGAMIAAAFGG